MQQLLKSQGVKPLAAAILAVGLMAGASPSWATTAATSVVRNVVTVNYSNAANQAQTPLTAAVDVSVNLVAAAATLSAPTDISTVPGTNAVYNYTITNGANGIATYNLSTSAPVEANISGSTAGPTPTSVTLGASTTVAAFNIPAAAGGTVNLTVPRDGTADTSINGIANGDTVVVRVSGTDYVFTASAVSDQQVPASPSTAVTTTLTLTLAASSPLPSGTVTAAVGTPLWERQNLTMTVVPGTMTSTTDATIGVTLTATDGTNVATDATVTTVATVGLSVTKLVRNVTTSAAGTGTAVTFGGSTYYPSGVTGNPSEVLEYLIVVTKSSSNNSATSVSVTDPIPVFTTFLSTAYGALTGLAIDNAGAGTFTNLTNATDADAAEFSGNNVVFRPGATAGTLGASATSRMKFQVTIQ